MINVTHDSHNRRARRKRGRIVRGVEQAFLDIGLGDTFDSVTELFRNQLGGVGVDHVVDLSHMALLHQQLDHIHRALSHAVGELLDGDGFRNCHFADELFFWLVCGMALKSLHAAAERCY